MYFRVNTPAITHQLIDGEVIALNLETGHYFSLCDSAARLWQLCAGGDLAGVVNGAVEHFQGDESIIRAESKAFVQQLLDEKLLVPLDAAPQQCAPSEITGVVPFSTPVLEKYTEMSDLLLTDPIHDVDQTGWPNVLPDKAPL